MREIMIDAPIALGLPSGSEWWIILLIVLLLFGGAKIPQLMRGIGKGVGEFQKSVEEGRRSFQRGLMDAEEEDEAKRQPTGKSSEA